jgi:4-amino-4-deoxy-L-arabinose transferase-like glycosyltransferase
MDLLLKIRWRPVIGDPSPMGWFTVVAYALAAFLAWRVRTQNRDRNRVWLGVTVLLGLLCLNKQLDLQSLVTDIGREFARFFGEYENRRGFQKFFIIAVLAVVAIFGPLFAWKYRAFLKGHKLLAAGLVFLLTFIVVRAISFHHMDVFLKTSRMGGIKMNWVLELTGIGLVALAAWREQLEIRLRR